MVITPAGQPDKKKARRARAEKSPPTQVVKPWRGTFRSIVTGGVAFIPLAVALVQETGLDDAWPWLASFIVSLGAIQRVLSTPSAEQWLAEFVPWLAADNYSEGSHRVDKGDSITVQQILDRRRE